MQKLTIAQAVGATSYPGRGILAGKTPDGTRLFLAYFIMGRSVNSRNRVFVEDGEGLRTRAFDPSKLSDPSLIIYAPVRVLGNKIIVTNGDQTDTVYAALQNGGTFVSALKTRTFEPDAPNFTPRISAMATLENGDFSLEMSVLKAADAEGKAALKCFYAYDGVEAGEACFIHTYTGDGSPPALLCGRAGAREPARGLHKLPDRGGVETPLTGKNRVSLWTRTNRFAHRRSPHAHRQRQRIIAYDFHSRGAHRGNVV